MAEPFGSRGAAAAAKETAAPAGIRPDTPTANRGRRREPPIIDLEAESSVSEPVAAARPAAPPPEPPRGEPGPAAPKRAADRPPPVERRGVGRTAFACLAILVIAGFAGGAAYVIESQGSLAALQGRVAQLEAGAKAAPTGLSDIDQRLTTAEAGIAGMSGIDKGLAGVAQRVAAAEAGVAAVGGLDRRIGAIESAVAAFETAADAAQAKADTARADAAKALAASADRGASPASPIPVSVDLGPIETRIGKVEARLSQVEAALSAPKTEARATQARAETPPAADRAAHVAAAAQALVRALDSGVPYAADLAALEALGIGPDEAAALKPLADTGAPTPRALAAQLGGLAAALPSNGKPAAAPAGFWGRLVSGAGGLVQVRQVGGPAHPDPASQLAQIAAAVDRGDLGAGLDLWGQLPDAARKATQPWADATRARAAADRAARGILSDALATLGKS